jgi:hypothetical protein
MTRKQPPWIRQIPQIRSAVKTLTTPLLGVRDVAQLFGVSSGEARRLLGRMGPMLHGNSLVVDTDDVLKLLLETEYENEANAGPIQRKQDG